MELDQDDLYRMAWADAKLVERRLEALRKATMIPGSGDKLFVRVMSAMLPESLSEQQQRRLVRLTWKYRRQLPRPLVPDINPDDPFANPRTGAVLVEVAHVR